MDDSLPHHGPRVRAVWAVGIVTTLGLWLLLTSVFFREPTTFLILAFIFIIPVTGSAAIWQGRLRRDYLDGYIPRRWSRDSLFWILGRGTTIGQKVVVFQTAFMGYLVFGPIIFLASTFGVPYVSSIFPTSISILLGLTFAGMIATLVGDALAVYLLTEH